MAKRANKFFWNLVTFGAAGIIDANQEAKKTIAETASNYDVLVSEANNKLNDKYAEVQSVIYSLLILLFIVIVFVYLLK
jgi:hypothetical protein